MTLPENWVKLVADEIREQFPLTEAALEAILIKHCPFKPGVVYEEWKEPPLLQCISCSNTESCAGAMARQWNHGRCMHCGGYFRVVRA